MALTKLGSILSEQEVLDVIWQRIPIVAVDISKPNEDGVVGGSGRILLANRPAEILFGYDMSGSLRGLAVTDLMPEGQRDTHHQHVSAYAKEPRRRAMGQRDMELRGRRRDGSLFPIAIDLIPAVIQDLPCVVCLIADMTGRVLHVPHGEVVKETVADDHSIGEHGHHRVT